MTHLTCEICGSEGSQLYYRAMDRNRCIDNRQFDVMRCGSCGVGFTSPQLAAGDLQRYYTREYYSLDNNAELEKATRPHNQVRVDRIRRFMKGGRLLDIGAGTGMFLKTARENDFDSEGLEINEQAAAFGRQAWGLNIRQGNMHETSLPSNTYDIVTLGHVFEHLHMPQAAARQLHSILKPGGVLVISVPNFDSLQARLFRSRWFHLDVPRHLFHYTPSSLTRLLETAGFAVVYVTYFSSEHNWAGILGSVIELSRPGESFMHKSFRRGLGTPVAKALAFVEAALEMGGTFELYARKQ